jgi:predicted metalloprotease
MIRSLKSLAGAGAVALALAACGSSTSSSTPAPASSSTSSAPGTSTATSTAATSAPNATHAIQGVTGRRPASFSVLAHATLHKGRKPHLTGLDGLSVEQKLVALSTSVASFWEPMFTGAQATLPPATIVVVDQTPAACGQTQVTSSSPPLYCIDGHIYLTLGFMTDHLEPIGDAAVALEVADMYGYHVLNAAGAFKPSANISAAALQEDDSCLSGLYFQSIEQQLEGSDVTAVNNFFAASAAPAGSGAGASAAQLTSAFNVGVDGPLDPSRCLQPGGVGSSS